MAGPSGAKPRRRDPAERFQRAVGVENFEGNASLQVDVENRLKAWALGVQVL